MGRSPSKIRYNVYFDYMKETSNFVDKIIREEINKYKDLSNLETLLEKAFHNRLSSKERTIPKLRSLALRLAYEIVGGKEWEKIAPACAAVELLDTSHYVCDDIFDTVIEDETKRNNLIIISHILYSLGQKLLYSLQRDFLQEKILKVIKESNRLHINIHKGFYSENFILGKISMKHIWERTKNYTFWDSLMLIGGILGGGNKEQLNSLKMFGENIGIAYTLANDACDFGKNCEDIKKGKITFPVYFALKNAEENDLLLISKKLGKWDCPKEELREIILAVIRSGAINYTRELATYYANKAITYLDIFEDSKIKTLLIYTTRIVHHNKWYSKLENLSKSIVIQDKIKDKLRKELKGSPFETNIENEIEKWQKKYWSGLIQ